VSSPTSPKLGPIFLVGMMGVGKSTVGPVLAERLARPFVDTDAAVEASAGRTIAEIFAQDGESAFRCLEVEAIEESSRVGAVVALGGGAISQHGMAERLTSRGTVVWLRAEPRVLLERIGDVTSRPLLAGLKPVDQLEKLRLLLEERRDDYVQAQIEVDAEVEADEVADRIVAAMGEFESKDR